MITKLRDRVMGFCYRRLLKPLFFLSDPENVHDRMIFFGQALGKTALGRGLTGAMFGYRHPSLKQTVAGINFNNPIGLAAGFDKNAQLIQILPSVGFGFEEIGSVTGEHCPGNPKPRLWRLLNSQSLLVYYGLKNDGAEAISERLKRQKFPFPVGISIAKTNNQACAQEQAGIADYAKAYRIFTEANLGDYFTINISCPNTFGGEPFTTPEKFDRLINTLVQISVAKPIFIKMPAEMPTAVLDQMLEVADKYQIAGFICTNLAKDRNNGKVKDYSFPDIGGMSGKIVQELSDKQIAYIYQKTKGRYVIIGCGGVFNAADAYKKIRLGASLIQLITGMIFQGPQVIGEINRDLAKLLERDGFKNIAQAVGADNKF